MDNDQKELTDKIRSAIKARLVEINAFVDDELPDYIMILVANKRSKSQIEKDLALFLGNDTVLFTNWLWDLVKNLKANPQIKSSGTVAMKDDSSNKRSPQSDEDVDVLDYDLDEQERAIFDLEDDSKNVPQVSTISKISQNHKPIKAVSNMEIKSTSNERVPNKIIDQHKMLQKYRKVHRLQNVSNTSLTSTVEQQRVNDDEYDPTKPDMPGNICSVVRVSQRNYGGPAALQANKLLLKAVNDATKSILDGQNIKDFYKPTPIRVLSSNKKEINNYSKSSNLVSVKIEEDFAVNTKLDDSYSVYLDDIGNQPNLNELEHDYIVSNSSQNDRIICLASDSRHFDNLSRSPINTNFASSYSEINEPVGSPHFIVTLDGVELPSFKRKYAEISDESEDDGIFDGEDGKNEMILPEKKQKITERCKYWPACKNRNNCVFHHPTVPCKCFPECKYGDKCLYIHPVCKFDAFCSRKDCPYTHTSKRKFFSTTVLPKPRTNKSVCKFYPKCNVAKCPFIHPKLCRYGSKCRLRSCLYSHYNIPPRNQMKWKANV